jgi:signal transduction histidine kinase
VEAHLILQRLSKELAVKNAELQREIAERKQAEAELCRLNAELAWANRLKDEFIANMNHEFRTPLNVILGMSEILQEQVYGPLNDKELNCARRIEESGRHLLRLFNDILDLSKIRVGKLELIFTPVSVQSICQASLALVKQLAQPKRITAQIMGCHDVTTIRADELRLKQILINLLTNAVKFTPEGGTIGLEVKKDPEQHVIHFSVWDTGIGIAKEDVDRLFKPFVQLNNPIFRKYEGAGLGLSLADRLAKLHGGRIAVESEVGKGSRFTLLLPWDNR